MITCVVVVGRPLLYVVTKVITDHRTFHCVDKANELRTLHPDKSESAPFNSTSLSRPPNRPPAQVGSVSPGDGANCRRAENIKAKLYGF
jgi:hypothetical protein